MGNVLAVACVAVFAATLLPGCLIGYTPQPPDADVQLRMFDFSPSALTVGIGQPVVFEAIMGGGHTVDFVEDFYFADQAEYDASLASELDGVSPSHGALYGEIGGEPYQRLTVVFRQPGTYQFFCQEHVRKVQWIPPPSRDSYAQPENFTLEGMVGTITVQA